MKSFTFLFSPVASWTNHGFACLTLASSQFSIILGVMQLKVAPGSIIIEIIWLEVKPSISTIVDQWSSYQSSRTALIWWNIFPTSPTVEASCKFWTILFLSLRHVKFILKWVSPHSQHFRGYFKVLVVPFGPRFTGLFPFCWNCSFLL